SKEPEASACGRLWLLGEFVNETTTPTHSRLYNSHMSEAIAFDTHRFAKHLTEGGLLNTNLATKSDIEKIEMTIKIAVEKAKADTTKWVLGVMLAQTTIILAFVAMPLGAPA
ncbi:MAG: hypothetical protein OXF31_13350, partial [Gammaproteobacteria bacterium]|nr:hypothetical protein [Gammaproteobacteria bacterium]